MTKTVQFRGVDYGIIITRFGWFSLNQRDLLARGPIFSEFLRSIDKSVEFIEGGKTYHRCEVALKRSDGSQRNFVIVFTVDSHEKIINVELFCKKFKSFKEAVAEEIRIWEKAQPKPVTVRGVLKSTFIFSLFLATVKFFSESLFVSIVMLLSVAIACSAILWILEKLLSDKHRCCGW